MTRTSARATRSGKASHAVTVPATGTALLLIDVINDLAFENSDPLVEQAEAMAPRLAMLKRRAAKAGVPSIYVNDNFGQWRSDFRKTVAHCTARTSPGHRVSRRLRPTATENDHALKQIRTVMKGIVAPSRQLLFRRSGRAHGQRTARGTGRTTAGVT